MNINNQNGDYPINPLWHEEISHASEIIKGNEGVRGGEKIVDEGSSCWLHYSGNIAELELISSRIDVGKA